MALAALVGLAVASAIFVVVGISVIRSESLKEQRAELDRLAIAAAEDYGESLRDAVAEGCAAPNTALAPLGTVIGFKPFVRELTDAACQGSESGVPEIINEQLSQDILLNEGIQRVSIEDEKGRTMLASAALVSIAFAPVGALTVARPAEDVTAAWRALLPRVLLAALSGLAVALALVIMLERRVTRPLRLLAAATNRVAQGDRAVTIGPSGTSEVDRLAASFNAMVVQLGERDRLSRDFLMRVTHDLRTPLTAIRGHAAALSDGIVADDDVPRSLAAIESESTRLERLVSDILDLGKLEARHLRLDVREVDLVEVVAPAFDLIEPACVERDVTVRRELPDHAHAHTDGGRVGQILANLLDNALRWTPEGGTVTVRMSLAPETIAIEVLDTGPGVPVSERERIFEAFQSQVTPDGRYGTGLGLATARQLARALGGDLTVDAAPGGGSVFCLAIPRSVDDGRQQDRPATARWKLSSRPD